MLKFRLVVVVLAAVQQLPETHAQYAPSRRMSNVRRESLETDWHGLVRPHAASQHSQGASFVASTPSTEAVKAKNTHATTSANQNTTQPDPTKVETNTSNTDSNSVTNTSEAIGNQQTSNTNSSSVTTGLRNESDLLNGTFNGSTNYSIGPPTTTTTTIPFPYTFYLKNMYSGVCTRLADDGESFEEAECNAGDGRQKFLLRDIAYPGLNKKATNITMYNGKIFCFSSSKFVGASDEACPPENAAVELKSAGKHCFQVKWHKYHDASERVGVKEDVCLEPPEGPELLASAEECTHPTDKSYFTSNLNALDCYKEDDPEE